MCTENLDVKTSNSAILQAQFELGSVPTRHMSVGSVNV